jgi:hypothetical protein
MPDSNWLEKVFHSSDVDEVVWQEKIDWRYPGALTVDVVVDVSDPINLGTDNEKIGLAYYPSGLVAAGVQAVRQGERRVFRNVLVKPGEDLVVALSSAIPVTVDVERAGQGTSAPPPAAPGEESTLDKFFRGLGQGTGGVLVLLVGGFLLVNYLEGKAAGKLAGSLL